jgi:hypothetical protein
MGLELRVCPKMIGWVVVEQFAGMMYLLNEKHFSNRLYGTYSKLEET